VEVRERNPYCEVGACHHILVLILFQTLKEQQLKIGVKPALWANYLFALYENY